MVYGSCPMYGGFGFGGMFFNLIAGALIFSVIFWGIYYLLKNVSNPKTRRKK
ncbi:MAG: hypothetical protein ABII01_06550 [Candidatus Woesearchaeota archaeon]